MTTVVNNQETNEGDNVFYIDQDKKMYEAIVKSIVERDDNHFADLEISKDGNLVTVTDVPHNTSPEINSWNHPRNPEEVALHNHPDFYGKAEEEN